jgi:tricorn protease
MFRKLTIFLSVIFLLFLSLHAKETKLLHYPDVYQNRVVFNYAGDLWTANLDNGTAIHLTTHPGDENYPHFSPDGKWIAFVGEYDGDTDVYLISSQGGSPQRLTYDGVRKQVVGWHPDGRVMVSSYFESGYYGPYLYAVSTSGGYPERIPIDRAAWASFSADGKIVAFNRRPGEFRNRKRYHGGQAPNVWIADLTKKEFKNITSDYTGINLRPLWIGGEIYFVSDRETNYNNLWAYDTQTGTFSRKTSFTDFAVYAPGTDGKSIVFEHGGSLYLYDVASGDYHELSIDLPAEDWETRPSYVNPAEHLGTFSVSSDGKWAVVDARGDIYKIYKSSGKWENLTETQGVRERNPIISPDDKYVAYFSDETGEFQLYMREAAKGKNPVQLTKELKTYPYHAVWSPDGQMLLFGDNDYVLRYVDVESKKMVKIDESNQQKDYEFYWEISEYDWSPDSKWVAYSKVEPNLNSALYLYSISEKKTYAVTDGGFDNFAPAFDRGGDYLYFLSNRHFEPALDPSEDNFIIKKMTEVCVIQLKSGMKPPFSKDEDEEASGEETASEFKIDLKGLNNRIYTVPIDPGSYKSIRAGKKKVFAIGKESYGFPGIEEFFFPGSVQDYFIKAYDMDSQEQVKVLENVGAFDINEDGSQLIYRGGRIVGILSTASLREQHVGEGKLDLEKLEMLLDVKKEWHQIFNEIWRWYRDFFYDPGMHGINWQKIHDQYAPLVDFVQTRNELNNLASEMVGELCASHMYIFRGDQNSKFKRERVNTGYLGADIVPDSKSGLYRIQKIFPGKSWDKGFRGPLASPEVNVRPGDYLLEIDGHKITTKESYLKYLVNKVGKKVDITVVGHPEGKDRRTFTVEPISSERRLRQWDWVSSRRDMVRKSGGEDFGYMHLDDMDELGLAQFEKNWKALKYKKGLIIDVRFNGGGFTNYFVIEKLERELLLAVKTRNFVPMRFPMVSSNAAMVSIINEFTGSDGELYTEHFKDHHLGKVVGNRTWGGLIGIINSITTVDGGIAVQPNVGFYNFQGDWIVENWGAEADPGLDIDITPQDGLNDKDPQLEKAIEVVKQGLNEVRSLPPAPPFPDKSPAHFKIEEGKAK